MAKHDDAAQDKPMIKKIADTEIKKHEKKLHGMKKGGVTGMAMKKMGRNMARAANQRSR
jgi:hypothetical protein